MAAKKAGRAAKKAATRLERLPQLLDRKIYKTGQTRGADNDEIFQNRVSRKSTVLIPFVTWVAHFNAASAASQFESGYIVLVPPSEYFPFPDPEKRLAKLGLKIGDNAMIFYESRADWTQYNPSTRGWKPAKNRQAPLGGQYVARIPATTATNHGHPIIEAFNTTANKGAGIRVYEYASADDIRQCALQLEALYWLCADSLDVVKAHGMTEDGAKQRRTTVLAQCKAEGLLDDARLRQVRIINKDGRTICPLCLEELSGEGFFSRMSQAEGREVLDLTVTQVSLFHIDELRPGAFNHRPYNLGWGHHHCNVVVKDAGIVPTLEWLQVILARNVSEGYLVSENSGSSSV